MILDGYLWIIFLFRYVKCMLGCSITVGGAVTWTWVIRSSVQWYAPCIWEVSVAVCLASLSASLFQ